MGGKLPGIPYAIAQWLRDNPGAEPIDGMVLSQPLIMGTKATPAAAPSTTSTGPTEPAAPHGIDTQVTKAEKAVTGQVPVKRNRFITLTGGTHTVNRDLEAKVRTLAGWKLYVTNLDADAGYVIGAYHQLWHVEHSFRMSKHDLKARPIYSRTRESIGAHLAIVFAALAVSHWIETRTGWTIKKLAQTLHRYQQVILNTGTHTITAEQPIPHEIHTILTKIHHHQGTNLSQLRSHPGLPNPRPNWLAVMRS